MVDSPTTFQVESIDVPQVNEEKTSCLIVIRGAKDSTPEQQQVDVDKTLQALERVVSALSQVADCQVIIFLFSF